MRRAALLALALAAFSPFEKEEETVRAGNERLLAGDPAGALHAYDEAERMVGRRPEIDLDRGNALAAEGRSADAAASFRRAAERARPALASRALQNLGTVLAASGDRDGALRAFAGALEKDPSNDDARWNLEVLLRNDEAARRRGGTQGGESGEEARSDAAPAPGRSPAEDARVRPERTAASDGPEPKDGDDDAGRSQGGDPGRSGGQEGGEPRRSAEPLTRHEAEKLLDALRARERNAPLFGRERRAARRQDAAKDW